MEGNFRLTFCIFIFCLSLQSCGAASKALVKGFPKDSIKNVWVFTGKNSGKFLNEAYKKGFSTMKNGRLIPSRLVGKLNGVRIPNASKIKNIMTPRMEGSTVAKNAVKDSEIKLILYDSQGNAIMYANQTHSSLIYNAATRTYQNRAVGIVDDIYRSVRKGKISNDAELRISIEKTLKDRLGARPYEFNVSTGDLVLNVEFTGGSQIVGNINIYNVTKKGLAIGAGGYFLVKKS